MQLFHSYYARKITHAYHTDFAHFEVSVWLHMVGRSLISIFIPILLLQHGYSLSAVIFYYLIVCFFDIPLNFVARRLTMLLGARCVIVLATLAVIGYFIIFGRVVNGTFSTLILLALLDAIYDALYWVSHIYLFYESSKSAEAGKSTGILNGIRALAGMLGPSIGAGLLLFGNQAFLIGGSIVFFILSMLPLLSFRHIQNKPVAYELSLLGFFSNVREKRDFVLLGLSSVHWTAENILWPAFIYGVFGTLKSIALVAVIVSVGKILFSYIAGTITAKNREALLLIGSVAVIGVWIGRLLYANDIFYYASILVAGFFAIMIDIPLETSITERAREKGTLNTATMRNASIVFTQFVLFLILGLLVEVFKVSFVMAIGSLFVLLAVNRLFLLRMRNSRLKM